MTHGSTKTGPVLRYSGKLTNGSSWNSAANAISPPGVLLDHREMALA